MKLIYKSKYAIFKVLVFVLIIGSIMGTLVYSNHVKMAYNTILNAETFSSEGVGYVNTMPDEIKAFATLRSSWNARESFIKIEQEATTEGKLYALCALYYLDYDYYNSLIKKYEQSDEIVIEQGGCIRAPVKLSDIIRSYDDNAVRLIDNKDTIDKWRKRDGVTSSYVVDFYGGGIPASLKDYLKSKSLVEYFKL